MFYALALPLGLQAQDASPRRDAGEANYPEEAIRRNQEGRVVLQLKISASGVVTQCTVKESSGSSSLDASACDTALKRVHYTPARDANGNFVESVVQLPVRYAMPK